MKKIISVMLVFSLLFGMLCIFTYATEEDTPYSGGSGTEEDPFLISCDADLQELSNNIKTDSYLWSTEYHYMLTNDIVTSTTIGQLITIGDLLISDDLCTERCKRFHWLHYGDTSTVPFVKWDENTDERLYKYALIEGEDNRHDYEGTYDVGECFGGYYNYHFLRGWDGDYDYSCILGYYRSASFTGVFDGNGHTITLEDNEYLFGYIENEAVIKNLRLKGENISIAYCVDQTSMVSDCVLSAEGTGRLCEYNYGTLKNCNIDAEKDYICFISHSSEISSIFTVGYSNSSMRMVRGLPFMGEFIVADCVNMGYEPYYEGVVLDNWIALSEVEPPYWAYSLSDCKAAGGDPSAYAGFDFENVWVMLNGMPYLRSACRLAAGDLDCNDKIGIVDSYMLKMLIAGAGESFEYRTVMASDINGDGNINSADSLILKRVVAGIESINEYRYKD